MDCLDNISSSSTMNGVNQENFNDKIDNDDNDLKNNSNSLEFKIDPSYAPKILRKNLNKLVRAPSSDSTDQSSVLVLYTGGTIGMVKTDKGVYAPQAGKLENGIREFPNLHDEKYATENFLKVNDKLPLVLPKMDYSHKRLVYVIYEYEPLLDSSNMTMDDWIHIALDIKEFYDLFDGFVILHGTDTMAYTASALSFMFEHLGKSVVITGSQIPLFEARSDGRENFLCSLIIAGLYNIPEVTVLFDNKVFRGNRTSKISTSSLNCFNSPNMRPLAKIGIKIQVEEKDIFRSPKIKRFRVHSSLNRNVGLLRLFPSITVDVVRAFMSPPIEGVVLQTYGAGNGPTGRKDLLEEIKKATKRGIIIVNCTQCCTGKVDNSYETGNILLELGVVPGSDMTPEAALAKLSYVLSKKEWSLQTKRQMMQNNLRGELTVTKDVKFEDLDIINAVVKTLNISSSEEKEALRNALYPSIVCSIAAANDLEKLEIMQQFGVYFSACDYNQRTPLHVASFLGHRKIVEYLLHHGANVHLRDFDHKTPLLNAIEHDHHEVIKLLIKAGANLNLPSVNVGDLLCRAVKKNRIQRLISLLLAGANINECDCGQRTALHVAVEMDNDEIVGFLLENNIDSARKDIYGRTALDIARILNRRKIIALLERNKRISIVTNGI